MMIMMTNMMMNTMRNMSSIQSKRRLRMNMKLKRKRRTRGTTMLLKM